MKEEIDISVIIPVYNSENCIELLVEKIVASLAISKKNFELILVDDFSADNSWNKIKLLKNKYSEKLHGVHLSKNFGQHNATFCGLKKSKGKYVITMDDDLQHNPGDISLLINELEQSGCDVVYAAFQNKNHSFKRRLIRFFIKSIGIFRVFSFDFKELSSFRVMTKKLTQRIIVCESSEVIIDELISWHTDKIGYLPLFHSRSNKTTSGYSFFKLANYSINTVINTSNFPLKVIAFLGFIMAFCSFSVGVYYIARKLLYSTSVEGYASIIVSILFSTGFISFTLAYLALYFSKLYRNQQHKPCFVELEVV